jgi:hypothetical protein
MRYVVTVSVVSARLERRLRVREALEVEKLLLVSRAKEDMVFLRCLLDTWDPSHETFMQWISENRPSAKALWRPLLRKNVLFLNRGGEQFLPKPSLREISRWYHNRSLGEPGLQALAHALYDALAMHLATRCSLVVTARCVGGSYDDSEYRAMGRALDQA